MNQPQQRHDLVQVPIQQSAQLMQVGDRLYQISEVPPQPLTVQPQPIQKSSIWDDQNTVILAGLGLVVGTGCLTWLITKAFAPAPAPAPAAQPQTVIVQPPQPEKKPYSYRRCEPAGLFGWGQNCQEERGWQ